MTRARGKASLRPINHHRSAARKSPHGAAAGLRPAALAAQLACVAMLAGTVCFMAAAHAQTVAPAATVNADVPAGPLADALNRFALHAGVAIVVDADKLRGRTSPGLKGSVTVEEGFRKLLEGSGLQIGRTSAGYVLVAQNAALPPGSTANATAAPLGEAVLPTVTVRANPLGEVTESTGSYTPAAIATATRLVLTPRETPQSISVVTRQEMDDFNLTSINKVMEHTPGVNIVTYDSERTEYYARGFVVQNFQYDGIPTLSSSAYSAGHTLSDTAIYDRVEVLKGSTGLLTGTGDPGAAINLIRKKPTRDFQGRATLEAGSWDNYRAELDLGGAVNAGGSVRGRAVVVHQDKHSHLDRYQRQTTVLYGILEADLTPRTLLTVGANYQDSDPTGSTWGGIQLFDGNGNFNERSRSFNNAANWSSWKQYSRNAFATLEHEFGNEWMIKLQFDHQINGYDAQLSAAAGGNPNPVNGTGVTLWGPTWYDGSTTGDSVDLYATGPFTLGGRRHELILGGSVYRRKWGSDTYLRQPGYNQTVANYYAWTGDVPYPTWVHSQRLDETTRENGAYAATRLNLHDDLKLIAGARVVNYKKETLEKSGVLVPYVGAVYDLSKNLSAYASYATIYQPQSRQTVQGESLDPMEGRNMEVGLKSAFFGGRLNASLAYFQLDQDNYPEVVAGGRTPSGDTAYRATQGVRTKGYEMELSGRLSAAWQMHAGFSHKVSRQNGQKVSTLTPENVFSLYTSYKPGGALDGLTLAGGFRWQARIWGKVTNLQDRTGPQIDAVAKPFGLFDVSTRYEINKHLSASLAINNLLDKKYYTVFNWYSTYTWGEPRNVNLSLTYKF
ncbi:MAG: TonB-dependent siderophore receptor [Rubrivivax sp.]